MSYVNILNRTFLWKNSSNFLPFRFSIYSPSELFRGENYNVILSTIILSGWEKQDFLDAIQCWKFFNYEDKLNLDCLNDLEQNIDKYLNEAIIKSIIE